MKSKPYRIVSAAFGLMFVGIAVAIIALTDRSAGPVVAAVVIGVLGLDAVTSALRNRPSLLSRIGPLP